MTPSPASASGQYWLIVNLFSTTVINCTTGFLKHCPKATQLHHQSSEKSTNSGFIGVEHETARFNALSGWRTKRGRSVIDRSVSGESRTTIGTRVKRFEH